MKTHRSFVLFACLHITLLPGLASAENLLQIFKLAQENDPTYKAAVATRDSAYESVKQSRGALLPNISFSASISDRDTDNEVTQQDSSGETTSYGVNLTQPLYDPAKYASHSQNKNYVLQADADFKAAEQSLIIRVSRQYFRVLGALDNLEFSKAETEANARQLEQTKQRFEVGLVAITDVHEAQARYDLSVSQKIESENILDNEVEALRAITSKYHSNLAPLQEESPLTAADPDDIEHWTKLALEQNPNLVSTLQFVEQSRDNIDLQRAGHKPTLDVNSNISHFESDNFENDTTTISLNFSMSLFRGGAVSAAVRQAEHNLTLALENLEEARRETQRQARNAFLGVRSTVAQVKALKQAVISSQSRLKASEAGFDVGTRTTVDVLDARRELYNSQRQYARARYDYILQKLQLKEAAGMLGQQDLVQINGWLQ